MGFTPTSLPHKASISAGKILRYTGMGTEMFSAVLFIMGEGGEGGYMTPHQGTGSADHALTHLFCGPLGSSDFPIPGPLSCHCSLPSLLSAEAHFPSPTISWKSFFPTLQTPRSSSDPQGLHSLDNSHMESSVMVLLYVCLSCFQSNRKLPESRDQGMSRGTLD